MKTEIEAKWLNANHNQLRRKLAKLGAQLVTPERLLRRKIYDYPDYRLDKSKSWVRVRDEGDKITLSYKQLNDRSLHGTKEITVVVDDFDATCSFLEAIGMTIKSYQETKRESWVLNNSEIELDTWPWIPTLVEIESGSEEELKKTAKLLGLDYSIALHGSVETAYQAEYNVTDEELNKWPEFVFSDIPAWLDAKKIK